MSMGIHKDAKFGKTIPQRFIHDAYLNGMCAEFRGEQLSTRERQRRAKHEQTWIEQGQQYGKYSLILGFSRKARGWYK